MNRRPILFSLVLLLTSTAFADWRREVKPYLGAVPNFEGAARHLQSVFPKASAEDKPQISFLLAYLYRKLNDHDSELFWAREHFENWGAKTVRFDFLGDAWNIDITDYCMIWTERYPLVHDLSMKPAAFSWAVRPQRVLLTFQSGLEANFRLSRKGEVVAEALLKKGENQLEIGSIPLDRSHTEEDLILEVWSPTMIIRKSLLVNVLLSIPEGVELADGQVRIKDKSFMPESKETVELKPTRYFDRKFFLRHFGWNGATAAALILGDQLFLEKKIHDDSFSLNREPLYYSARIGINILAVGLAAKAVVGLVHSFKTFHRKVVVKDESAVEYNRFLTEMLRQAERNITIRLEVKATVIK